MAKGIININSDEFVLLTNKLEKISRADLPVAIRSTLNNTAFRMKGSGGQRGQIDKRAEQDFDYRRNRTIIKKLTGVEKAKGLDIKKMQSEAGIVKASGLDEVAEGLADQQKGGSTKQKATPLSTSRIGKSPSKKVRRASRLRNLSSYDMRNKKGSRWVAAAIRAKKDKRTILIDSKSGTPLIARVKSFKRGRKGVRFKLDFLYRINKSGKVSLKKKRPFVNTAAQEVIKDLPKEFVKQANKRISKSFK